MINQPTTKRYLARGKNVTLEGFRGGSIFTRHGDVTLTDDQGKLELTGKYVYGKPAGEWIHWHENGQIESVHHYTNGLLNGGNKQYWDNGALAREGNYKDGYPEGEHKMYDRHKKLVRHVEYKRKKIVKAKLQIKDKWLEYDLSGLLLKLPWDPIFEKICLRDQHGLLECMTVLELWEKLLTSMSPEEAENFLRALNDLYAELGLDIEDGVITSCGGTFVATSVQDQSSKPAGRPGGNIGGGNILLSQHEIDEIVSACKEAQVAELEPRNIHTGVQGDMGVGQARGMIGETIGECHDANSMIAQMETYDPTGGTKTPEERTAEAAAAIGRPGNKVDLSGIWDTAVRSAKAVGEFLAGVFEAAATGAPGTGDPHVGSDTGQANSTTASPSAGMPVDESGMSKCEQLQQWWSGTLEMCDQVQWSSYQCREILRIFSGCADPALVYPTPDGGVGCPIEGGMTDEEFRAYECRRKSWIMLPDPNGNGLCVNPGNVSYPERPWADPEFTDPVPPGPDTLVPSENSDGPQRAYAMARPAGRTMGALTKYPLSSYGFSQYSSLNALDDLNFDKTVESKKGKIDFVVFASKSCGPCHKVLDVFQEQTSNFKDTSFHYVDVSQNPELHDRFEIKYTPTILVFKNGAVVGQRRVGAASREVLSEYVKRSITIGDNLQEPS